MISPDEVQPFDPKEIGIPETWGNAQGPPCREFELDKIIAWIVRRVRRVLGRDGDGAGG